MKRMALIIPVVVLATFVMSGCTPTSTPEVTQTPDVSAPAPSTPGATVSNPVVIIKYTPTFVLVDSRYILVVNVSIENQGYDSFNTSLEYFHVVVSNAKYPCDTLSSLRTVDIPNGGKILGKLAFEVPTGTSSSRVGYDLVYSGVQLYNVQWFKMP